MAGESASAERLMRIGEVAKLTGTTARTIRYYEEIGLLGSTEDREQGKHRSYTEADVERFREIVRLRDLLGLSLDQLCQLVEAETARAEIRRELGETDDPARRRELLSQAQVHIETQLGLVDERLGELNELHDQLVTKLQLVAEKIDELSHELELPTPKPAEPPLVS
jgi:DNA-binding transcriptional MerR regulator